MNTFDPLPLGWPIDHAKPQPSEPLALPNVAIDHALAHPLSSLPLADLCSTGSRITVVVSIAGHERDIANAAMLPALLGELQAAGVRDEDITLLIPNALHHPSTAEEKLRSLGEAVVSRYKIVDHDPTNIAELDDLGTYQNVPLQINFRAVEADLLVAIDVVEPHYYAGYSGGHKTVSLGCAGEATLNEVRTARFLDDLSTHPALSRDNLNQMVEREIGRRAGLMFVLNAVVDLDGQVVAVSAGAPNAVQDALVDVARRVYEVDVPRSDYNIIIAGNGPSRVRTLYHASRAAVAIGMAQEPVLVKGGVIILPVRCSDTSAGARRPDTRETQFYEALAGATDMDTVMRQLSQRGIRTGEQRAYMLAQIMIVQKYHVIVVGADCADLARDCGLIPAHNMLEAASLAETIVGKSPRVLMLPHAAHLIPIARWRPEAEDDAESNAEEDIYIRPIISDN
jgi:nickel-dependent lactate racemase